LLYSIRMLSLCYRAGVSRAIEQVESAERDLSAAQSFTNQSTTVVDQNFTSLQTSINTSLIKVSHGTMLYT